MSRELHFYPIIGIRPSGMVIRFANEWGCILYELHGFFEASKGKSLE
jgi:hypothetical protein